MAEDKLRLDVALNVPQRWYLSMAFEGHPKEILAALNHIRDQVEKLADDDNRPHSRACGIKPHSHGPECSPDCPTCSEATGQTRRIQAADDEEPIPPEWVGQ